MRSRSFTGHTIDALQDFHDRLGFWPRLAFDRGFGNESIVTHLVAERATFSIRVKSGRYVEFDGQQTKVKIQDLKQKDTAIRLYGLTLRVVGSPKDGKNDDRFEIEETFKDTKHIFELKRTRLNRPLSLKFLLWFVALGIALLYKVTGPTKLKTSIATSTNPKKQISWLRQAYEQLHQAYGLVLWGEG